METLAEAANKPVWKLDWLTPWRCRALLLALMLFGFLSHLSYLRHDCPIDLSGDEAHYWDWSRQLDLNYYSKGPAVAYIIRASCAVFGDQMWAVRLPALIFAAATTILTYWLTKKLFASERLALGAVLLYHLVPVFIAGSILMTIDPPFFFCWAMVTCLFAKAVGLTERGGDGETRRQGEDLISLSPCLPLSMSILIWLLIGIFLGLGILAKWGMLLWPVSMLIFLLMDRDSRKLLRSPWPYLSVAISLLFLIPAIIWNQQHNWVTLHHVAQQTGAEHGQFSAIELPELLLSQIAILGPSMALFIIAAIVVAGRSANRAAKFLVWIGSTFFIIVSLATLHGKVQANWPAPAYFTLMILAAWFIGTRLQTKSLWKPWRFWLYGGVIFGLILAPIAHDMTVAYPLMRKIGIHNPRQFDPTARLHGWQELGQHVDQQLKTIRPGAFIVCDNYQVTGETAFYAPGQPKTYYIGSYWYDPKDRERLCQYDLWPDRSLDPATTTLLGKDAIFIGWSPQGGDLKRTFDRVERLPNLDIARGGVIIKTFRLWRCINFKGIARPTDKGSF